jgi:SAM-dependent methyltransferase
VHDTALDYGRAFFHTYMPNAGDLTIVDIGSRDVNGSLRSVAPQDCTYVGIDFAEGRGVDVVLADPYVLPFADATVDTVVSSSCFEHAEFFWLLFNEALRILKPSGILYINAPSNGTFHRYPVDCWRFYPDCGVALQNWGRRCGYNCALLESFVGQRKTDVWIDFVAVFVRDENYASRYVNRIQAGLSDFSNGRLHRSGTIIRLNEMFC